MDRRWLVALVMIGCSSPAPRVTPPPARTPSRATVADVVDQLSTMSLAQHEIAKGTAPERLVLALLTEDGTVSAQARQVLGGTFTLEPTPGTLVLRGPLDSDPSRVLTIQIVAMGPETARLVHVESGETVEELGLRGKVRLSMTRDPTGLPSQAARLRAASLWALLGENVHAAYAPAEFDAAVLGTRLLRNEIPAMFSAPGRGTWVLLKTMTPDELYVAFDTSTGRTDVFPKTPNVPNAAARAVFRAL